MGDFKDSYSFGFGASFKGAYTVVENGAVTLGVGFINFSPKSDWKDIGGKSVSYIPIKAGFNYNFGGFYVEPQIGFGLVGKLADGDKSRSGFLFAPNVGYKFGAIDVSARYESCSIDGVTLSHIGARVAYNF